MPWKLRSIFARTVSPTGMVEKSAFVNEPIVIPSSVSVVPAKMSIVATSGVMLLPENVKGTAGGPGTELITSSVVEVSTGAATMLKFPPPLFCWNRCV